MILTEILRSGIIFNIDISETKFTMNIINRKWNEKLKTKASTEFQQLEARLRRIVSEFNDMEGKQAGKCPVN